MVGVPSVELLLGVGLSVGVAAGVEVMVVYTVTIGGSSVQSPPSSVVVLLSADAVEVAASVVELSP